MKKDVIIKNHKSFSIEPLKGKNVIDTLKEGTDLLNMLGMKWWLSAGTILGLHRDGDFIPHDTDIDIGIEGDHYKDGLKIETLITLFEESGFELIRTMYYEKYPMQIAFRDSDNVIFDIYFYYPVFDKMINYNEHGTLSKSSSYFCELDSAEYMGHEFNIPHNVEKYLVERYGEDWNVPKQIKESWEKDAANLS